MKTKRIWISKIILGLLCVLMLAAAAGCGQNSSTPVSEWNISSARMAGKEMDLDAIGLSGAIKMTIAEDGTLHGSTDGVSEGDGSWEKSGDTYVFDMDGVTLYGHMEDGKLLLYDTQDYESAQQVMIFERG